MPGFKISSRHTFRIIKRSRSIVARKLVIGITAFAFLAIGTICDGACLPNEASAASDSNRNARSMATTPIPTTLTLNITGSDQDARRRGDKSLLW